MIQLIEISGRMKLKNIEPYKNNKKVHTYSADNDILNFAIWLDNFLDKIPGILASFFDTLWKTGIIFMIIVNLLICINFLFKLIYDFYNILLK